MAKRGSFVLAAEDLAALVNLPEGQTIESARWDPDTKALAVYVVGDGLLETHPGSPARRIDGWSAIHTSKSEDGKEWHHVEWGQTQKFDTSNLT